MISFLRRHRRRIQEIGIGLTLYEGFNWAFDFLFYPFALLYWGVVDGALIVFALSLIINMAVFWLYERMRVDWLGAHALRQLEDEENKSAFVKIATWVGKKKERAWEKLLNPLVFAALLIPIDPVIVAIHYRRQHFQGLTWRDWRLLIVATIVANAWWILKIELVIEAVKILFNLLSTAP